MLGLLYPPACQPEVPHHAHGMMRLGTSLLGFASIDSSPCRTLWCFLGVSSVSTSLTFLGVSSSVPCPSQGLWVTNLGLGWYCPEIFQLVSQRPTTLHGSGMQRPSINANCCELHSDSNMLGGAYESVKWMNGSYSDLCPPHPSPHGTG